MSAPSTLCTAAMDAALSDLVGHPVRLVTLPRPGGASTSTVMPVDSRMRQAGLWMAMLESPLQMAWPSRESALVGFAASLATWVAASRRRGLVDPAEALLETLAGGPLPAADVYRSLAAAGFSKDRIDRAARRMGVVRLKGGMACGWLWAMPAECRLLPSPIDTKDANTASTEDKTL